MPRPELEGYEFGPYRIEAVERLLHRGDELIPLPPKVADTLLVLLRNAGRMVEKSELLGEIWRDTFVEEGALTRNISLLRKTLGENGDEAAYIETIPKRGYRFVAEVRKQAAGAVPDEQPPAPQAARAVWRQGGRWIALAAVLLAAGFAVVARYGSWSRNIPPPPGPAPASRRTLAVLPFRSLERNASRDYFADGMTQALITGLARLREIRVVSLASESGERRDADAWNAILRDDSVSGVLTGTILHSGNRVRIDAQLIDPRTRAVHWANSYERDIQDVLALEAAVAEAIAAEIQTSITAEERGNLRPRRSTTPEALDAYLRGRYFWNRRTEDGLRRAARYFQQAIEADPSYAPAYSGLADSYSLLGSVGTDGMPPHKAMPVAKAAARKAIELDPGLAEGHVSLAYIKLSYDWDLAGAAQEFSRALRLNPNSATAYHWYSHYYMAAGDLGKATEQMREAARLEPLSPSINIGVGWCLYYSRQYDQAIAQYRSVAEMDPSLPLAHQTLGMAYQQKGMMEQAIEEFRRAAAFSANSPASVAALASALAISGRKSEAGQELARLEAMSRIRYVPAFYFASIHHAMGDLTKTLQFGWKAVGERCDYLMYLRVEPRVGKLAGHPEFIRAMAALQP